MANDRVHQTCRKVESEYSNCQAACDKDKKCKGFVLKRTLRISSIINYCVLATNEKCEKGWKLKDGWAAGGPLSPHSRCNKWNMFGYKGCFIKNTGKLSISLHSVNDYL